MLISHSAVVYACGHCWRVVSGWGWWPVIIGAICAIIPPALLLSVNTNPFILIIISLIVQPLASTEHWTTRMYRKCCWAFFTSLILTHFLVKTSRVRMVVYVWVNLHWCFSVSVSSRASNEGPHKAKIRNHGPSYYY